MIPTKPSGKYGSVTRSTLRNLQFAMLVFGLGVGLIFPFFARVVLKAENALSPVFFLMCVTAGLIVGIFNFYIFRVNVSRELTHVQQGMNHVNENISTANVLEDGCQNNCLLELTSADIIGDIELSFNSMTEEIFKRLEMEGQTKQLNESLIKSVELEDVARSVLKRIGAVLNAKGGLLYGGTPEKMDLLADFGIDKSETRFSAIQNTQGPISHTLEIDKVQIFSKTEGWEWISQSTPMGRFKPKSIVLIPLTAKRRTVGLVMLACGNAKLDEKQKKMLETLRAFAAPYLDNAMLHRKITELAAVDELTGLVNRRFGVKRLKDEFSRSARHGTPLSIMMIDIDHFKVVNDTFGHNAGDVVLKAVATILGAGLRSEDMVCRYGGEEFLLLLSGAGMVDCALAADRLRRVIEAEEIQWETSRIPVTVSIGVTSYPMVRVSIGDEMVGYADKALYTAKESGRNRVVVNDGFKTIDYATLEISDQSIEKKNRKA